MLPEITEKLIAHMISVGIVPAEELHLAGAICRFEIEGDTPGKRNGWCALNLGEFPFASFGSWKTGKKFVWQLKKPTTPSEMRRAKKAQAEARDKYEADRKRKYIESAEMAQALLDKSEPAPTDHPYLVAKKIQAHGLRHLDGALLVPMFYNDNLASVQGIYPTGEKVFLRGGRVKGSRWFLDVDPDMSWEDLKKIKTVYIAEGVATAASLREHCSGSGVLFCAAFTAGNLRSVAKATALNCPNAEIILAADNDQWTPGNPGLEKAREAAAYVGGSIIYPDFDGMDISGKPTDFNDYSLLGGALCL